LAKAAVPMLIQPVVAYAVAIATQLVLLTFSLLVLGAGRGDLAVWWAHIHMPDTWAIMTFGLFVNALWDVPFYAWLLLVSAWAKRLPFVWAIAPWLGLWLLEFLIFHTNHVRDLLRSRIFGGYDLAYAAGGHAKDAVPDASHLDLARFLANPGLWAGLVAGALMLAACVWLRRRHDPL
jgi:ABC-2 type transport system permease protein